MKLIVRRSVSSSLRHCSQSLLDLRLSPRINMNRQAKTFFKSVANDQSDKARAFRLQTSWEETSWCSSTATISDLMDLTVFCLENMSSEGCKIVSEAAKDIAALDDNDPLEYELTKNGFIEIVSARLGQEGIKPPEDATAADDESAYSGSSRSSVSSFSEEVLPPAKRTEGLSVNPITYLKAVAERKQNEVDLDGHLVTSEQHNSEDEDDDDTAKRDIVFGKGKKKRQVCLNETLMQMPQALGVSMPVYANCKEAELIERLSDDSELALLGMFAFARHLPTRQKHNKFLGHLRGMNVNEAHIKEIEKAFKDGEKDQKRLRQSANAIFIIGDLFRRCIAALNGGEEIGPEQLLQMEKAAAVFVRLGTHKLMGASKLPVERFSTLR